MRSYLSLIPISAKVHKRQNRMTILCIIFSVFLVTAIFSMAEMGIRMEQARLLQKHDDLSFGEVLNSTTGQTLCITAVMFFVLVLIAGVLMISSSINSNVNQRTKFFGMMRCIGMSKQQIIHFVKLEALNWCKSSIPIGILLGIIVTWVLCAVLRFVVGEEFTDIPVFGISIMGIISGVIVGVMSVLLAAIKPAKYAAKVSPVTAASGNSGNIDNSHYAANIHGLKIESALGIHHAISAKKTLFLMTGSFALSIILFLSFSALVEFVDYLLPQSAATSDITISSVNGKNDVDHTLIDTLSSMNGVKHVFGRRSMFDVSAKLNGSNVDLDMISYDDFDLDCIVKDKLLRKGSDISKVYGNSNYVLATWDKNSILQVGDKITVDNDELEIAGFLKYDPFSSNGLTNGEITLIASGETFMRLTGIENYSLVMVQTTSEIKDSDVETIRSSLDSNSMLTDLRDQGTSGTYFAFVFCIYAFLSIIALVTVLNIINNISMSVSSRMKSYGAMRAVGMDETQLTKMIVSEAFTYSVTGGVVGCVMGLLLYTLIYKILILNHFDYAVWHLPIQPLLIILTFICISAIVAAYIPSKRICKMPITATINEL